MLPSTIAVVNAGTSIEWDLGTPALADVKVSVFGPNDPAAEIAGSPFACAEHSTIPGVYLFEALITEPGTYVLKWSGAAESKTAEQNLIVVEHLTNEPTLNFKVTDAETRLPMEGVRAVVMEYDKSSGDFEVIEDLVTDSGGYGSTALDAGEYVLFLQQDDISFSTNNFFFTIDPTQIVKPLSIEARYITVPALPAQSPTNLVSMSVYLIGPSGQPLRYRNISVISRRPTAYTPLGGTDFIVAEGTILTKTDTTGQAHIDLVPGAEIEVTIEGTSLNRRFTVPIVDFNMQAYVGGDNDYFNVVGLPYPAAETP